MKILFVTPEFIEKNKPASGMPNYIYRTALFLQSLGHECFVVTGGRNNRLEQMSGLTIYRVNTLIPFAISGISGYLLKKIMADWKLQKKVREICAQKKIEIIQYAGHSGTGLFHNSKKVNAAAVMRMSTYTKYYYACYEKEKRKLWTISALENMAAKRMNSVYAPSHVIAEAVSKNIGKRVGVIESPFYNEICQEDNSVYSEKLMGIRYFLYFGGMDLHKGIFVISDMLNKLLLKYKNYYFVFCGSDPQGNIKKILEQNRQVRDRIIWLGAQPHEKLYPIIKNAELVVLPSLMENLSNACMEAMSFGKIVVATDGTSYEQLIHDRVSGFLAKPGDAESLYQKISEAMALTPDEKAFISEMAQKGMEMLRPEVAVKKLLCYYGRVISSFRHRNLKSGTAPECNV